MRDYSQFRSSFWTGETGQELRKHGDAQRLAAYLFTSPHHNIIGFYWLPLDYAAREVGLTPADATPALAKLQELDFAHYDQQLELVWVVNMAREQLNLKEGESLSEKDNRGKAVRRAAEAVRRSVLYPDFHARYASALELPPPRSPSGAPSRPPSKGESTASEEQKGKELEEKGQERPRPAGGPAAGAAALSGGGPANGNSRQEEAPGTGVRVRVAELEQRYAPHLVVEARAACALSRRNGTMADTVWLTTLEKLAKAPIEAVERGFRIFAERHADGQKDERYLLGIVRGELKPVARDPRRGVLRAAPASAFKATNPEDLFGPANGGAK